jgi:glycerol kinase
MSADSGVKLPEMRVDGGITANALCMQMQADIMGIDVIRPQIIETTALGAAYAAGLAVGFFKDISELRTKWQEGRRWKANSESTLALSGYKQWKKAIEKTLNWLD